jgi:hypothetical protein
MRCIVLETQGRNAILLSESCEVIRVKNRGYRQGQRIVATDIKTTRFRFAAAGAVFTMLLFLGGLVLAYFLPYSEVRIDAGARIVFKLNYLNQVIEVRATDPDAQTVLDGLGLSYTDLATATGRLCPALLTKGYVTGKTNIELSASSEDRARAQEMLDTAAFTIDQITSGWETRPDVTALGVQ